MQHFFAQSTEQLLETFQVGENGLSEKEVQKRRNEWGYNLLVEKKRKSIPIVFLEQFQDFLVWILLAAAIISAFSGNLESTIVIIAVLILNAILGTIQHFNAERSLKSLKALSSPNAKVIRDGKKMEIPSSEVVPGDILVQEAGDMIVADGRILKNYSLQVNESSLTGESENVSKTDQPIMKSKLPLGDQRNMVFSGSFITYGHAVILVTATGMHTEMGKIAALMNQTQERRTPLQISLDNFSKKLAIIIMLICTVVFGAEMFRGMALIDSLLFAVALAVAAIPEALGSIVTIVQAMGTQKMVREHAIIKELKAVESLGSVSVICSDKTGTLTQNRMTVQQVYCDKTEKKYQELSRSNPVEEILMDIAVLTNDSVITEQQELGDPTEIALLAMSRSIGVDDTELRQKVPRITEIPFDSDRKLMSTLHQKNDSLILFTKGALEVLLERTTRILTNDGIEPISQQQKETIFAVNQKMSENGLRVLAFAFRNVDQNETITAASETDYTFVGLVSMIDPPRVESKQAVADAKRAGIRTIMITGDHKTTASAIAKEIGILEEGQRAITGLELEELSDAELENQIADISVYARVSPEHKIRIVNAWQKRGQIVAMTGDGVNDAPALKKADVGVAMGITGTEVSKDAAAMILTDDNFATIVKSVQNGRNVYTNIKNSIQFLLSGNAAGIIAVLYTAILGLSAPFVPVQLLFINLLTDSLPAIAIGMELSQDDLLGQPPRNPKESILNRKTVTKIGVQGLLISLFTIIAYHIGAHDGVATLASTMAFCTLTLARLFHGFNCRGKKSIFHLGFFSNIYSIFAFFSGFLFLSMVMFIPFFMQLFSVAALTVQETLFIYLLAFAPTLFIQLYKIIRELAMHSR